MGKSLARNFASKGLKVAVYNLPFPGEEDVVSTFVTNHGHEGILGGESIQDLVQQLALPRIVLLMVKSGAPVDELIQSLLPELSPGDIIIDAGNSYFKDTIRRVAALAPHNIEFVGMGVSGGEEGALKGPSIMPAGSKHAKTTLLPMLSKIAAKVDETPCVTWIGTDGAGHFVKMVHNGIEYADMQIIADVFHSAKKVLQLDHETLSRLFEKWNSGDGASYLMEITAEVLRYRKSANYLIDQIVDVAESKGTGLWTLQESLLLGVPVPTIGAAVNARLTSAQKGLRMSLDKANEAKNFSHDLSPEDPFGAIMFARLVAMAEGMDLIYVAAKRYGWSVGQAALANIWRGGCIIRSQLLHQVIDAYTTEPHLRHLFLSKTYSTLLRQYLPSAQKIVAASLQTGVPTPAIAAALQHYMSMHSGQLPQNLIQAQRDYFGAHQYKRLDGGDEYYHTDWKK